MPIVLSGAYSLILQRRRTLRWESIQRFESRHRPSEAAGQQPSIRLSLQENANILLFRAGNRMLGRASQADLSLGGRQAERNIKRIHPLHCDEGWFVGTSECALQDAS